MPRDFIQVEMARIFATAGHAAVGQTRKYTLEPYYFHSQEVAEIVATVKHTDEMLMAAWLHDVVEDTNVTIDLIKTIFGPEVATLVEMLTDVSNPLDGNRAVRKAIDRDHTAKASPEAKTIKLADMISNTARIVKHDLVGFARVYIPEKVKLLEVLRDGDPVLWDVANRQVGTALQQLGISMDEVWG